MPPTRLTVRQRLRQHPAYTLWRKYRECQQLKSFNAVLDTYLNHQNRDAPAYSEALTRDKLEHKRAERRFLSGADGKPSIVAFGTRDWEQYGLWPSFDRLSHFKLFEYDAESITGPRLHHPGPAARHQLTQRFLAFMDQIEQERPVDCVFFYASGRHISDQLLTELARRGTWTVIMSLDDKHMFAAPTKGDTPETDQIRVARRCDLYWTNWRLGAQLVLGLGGTPWYAPTGADPAFHHSVDISRDLDIVFIGQAYGERVSLVRYLRRRGFRVETFGSGWPNGFVSFEETIELYSRAKIVLGVGGVQSMQGVKHLKGRDFEVPMCESVYLTSYNPELADFYEIGKEILCYSSPEECASLAHWVLSHPGGAERIRRAAGQRSRADHTWERRLSSMCALLPIKPQSL